MSAFLVGERTIHKILTQVDYEVRRSEWFKQQFEKKLHVDFDNANWQTHLGQKLWDLNQLALGYRYGDEKIALHYRFSPFPATPVQAFKALQCFLYQCAEGDIPEASKLYKFFDEVVTLRWAEAIITHSKEYDDAEWG